MRRMTLDEIEILRAATSIYVAQRRGRMSEAELCIARFTACNEAAALYTHILAMDVGKCDEVLFSNRPELKREVFRESLQRLGKPVLVQRELNLSRQTFYNWLKQWGRDFIVVHKRYVLIDVGKCSEALESVLNN